MAKWGKGDPRSVVENRSDGINVNNWHWTEKDASAWSQIKFKELFVGLKVETDFTTCVVTELVKCDGYAAVNNRKCKLIFFYEWNIEMKWKGKLVDDESEVEGKIEIVDFTDENKEGTNVIISLDSKGSVSEILRDVMECRGVDIIRSKLSVYLTMLKEFSKNIILPSQYKPSVGTNIARSLSEYTEPAVMQSDVKRDTETTVWECIELFKCSADEFYRAMTDKELVKVFTQGDCILESTECGRFELFGGNVRGYFTKLKPYERIELKWRFATWPENHFSDVIMNINQKADCTEVIMSQHGIPKSDLENTIEGWKKYYWDSMKKLLGFGAFLY